MAKAIPKMMKFLEEKPVGITLELTLEEASILRTLLGCITNEMEYMDIRRITSGIFNTLVDEGRVERHPRTADALAESGRIPIHLGRYED